MHYLCTTTRQAQIEIWVVKCRGIVTVKNCAFTYKVTRSIEVQVVLFGEEFKGKGSYSGNYERLSTSGKIHQHEDRVFELNIKQCQLKKLTRRQNVWKNMIMYLDNFSIKFHFMVYMDLCHWAGKYTIVTLRFMWMQTYQIQECLKKQFGKFSR